MQVRQFAIVLNNMHRFFLRDSRFRSNDCILEEDFLLIRVSKTVCMKLEGAEGSARKKYDLFEVRVLEGMNGYRRVS